jgi:hypothetical protein
MDGVLSWSTESMDGLEPRGCLASSLDSARREEVRAELDMRRWGVRDVRAQ